MIFAHKYNQHAVLGAIIKRKKLSNIKIFQRFLIFILMKNKTKEKKTKRKNPARKSKQNKNFIKKKLKNRESINEMIYVILEQKNNCCKYNFYF